jgi:hypothetical protein
MSRFGDAIRLNARPPDRPAAAVFASVARPLFFTVHHLKQLLSNRQTYAVIEVRVTPVA